MNGWTKKSKGGAHIYSKEGVDGAVVDRRGLGLSAALGHNVTFRSETFADVETAMAFADANARFNEDQELA